MTNRIKNYSLQDLIDLGTTGTISLENILQLSTNQNLTLEEVNKKLEYLNKTTPFTSTDNQLPNRIINIPQLSQGIDSNVEELERNLKETKNQISDLNSIVKDNLIGNQVLNNQIIQNQTTTDNLKNKTDGLASIVYDEDNIGNERLGKRTGDLENIVNDTSIGNEKLGEDIDSIDINLSKLNENTVDSNNLLTEHNNYISDLSNQIIEMKNQTLADDLKNKTDGLISLVYDEENIGNERLGKRTDDLENTVNDTDIGNQQLGKRTGDLETTVNDTNIGNQQLGKRTGDLETTVNDVDIGNITLGEKIQLLGESTSTMEAYIDGINNNVKDLKTTINQNNIILSCYLIYRAHFLAKE